MHLKVHIEKRIIEKRIKFLRRDRGPGKKKPKYSEQTKFKTQHTRAGRLVAGRLARRSATTRTISAVASIPVLATSAPMSLRKDWS